MRQTRVQHRNTTKRTVYDVKSPPNQVEYFTVHSIGRFSTLNVLNPPQTFRVIDRHVYLSFLGSTLQFLTLLRSTFCSPPPGQTLSSRRTPEWQDLLSALIVENGGQPLRVRSERDPWRNSFGHDGPARAGRTETGGTAHAGQHPRGTLGNGNGGEACGGVERQGWQQQIPRQGKVARAVFLQVSLIGVGGGEWGGEKGD